MIQEIQIKNFSIIESARLSFHEGFHVLSGETGAGKSFLVQAISFALGSRADSDSLRSGAPEASVTLILDRITSPQVWEVCGELGVDLSKEEGQLHLRRTLNAAGRSRAYINDQSVTLKSLQKLGDLLVHQVGQHAAQQLLDELFLFKLLDQFSQNQEMLEKYQKALKDYHLEKIALDDLHQRARTSREQEDFYRFQCQELETAHLREGEEEELEAQKQRLKHRVTLAHQSYEISQILSEGEFSLLERLGRAVALGEKIRTLDPSLETWVKYLEEALDKLNEADRGFGEYVQTLQEDPESFDQVESRLAHIHELKRKYRMDVAGLTDKLQELKKALTELEDFDTVLADREAKLERAQKNLEKSAEDLRSRRKEAAEKISRRLKDTLAGLALPHARISWVLEPFVSVESYKNHGAEALILLVSFNPGEELRPFQEVISGGELSRLLLAIYEVLYPGSSFGTFIFDEVDAGVSGGVAELIGRKLSLLGRQTQVLCITHLPQIACQALWHYTVEKEVRKGRTFSGIRELKREERVEEIARMLAGVEVTQQALKHAKELLKNYAA